LLAVGRSARGLFSAERGWSFRSPALRHASSLYASSPRAQAALRARADQTAPERVHESAESLTAAAQRASKRSRRARKQVVSKAGDRALEPFLRSRPGDFDRLKERKVEFFRALRLQCASRPQGRASAPFR
jgi:hypothetical protein